MFQYEFERPQSQWRHNSRSFPTASGNSRAWGRGSDHGSSKTPSEIGSVSNHSRRALPLPPRNAVLRTSLPTKQTVPLKVWIIASASCFAVCAALVLATVVITKWGTSDSYTTSEHYFQEQSVDEPIYARTKPVQKYNNQKTRTVKTTSTETPDIILSQESDSNDVEFPILEKLSIFKNMVAKNRKNEQTIKKPDNLVSKPQIHPIHDTSIEHEERKIEKKDQPKMKVLNMHKIDPNIKDKNFNPNKEDQVPNHNYEANNKVVTSERKLVLPNKKIIKEHAVYAGSNILLGNVPEFKPSLPDVFARNKEIALQKPFMRGYDYTDDYYYNDENLYSDYMQSNSMTSYLIEKVQELHDWITTDADFEIVNNASAKFTKNPSTTSSQLLKSLNESLVEGNVTIIMNKLKDIYFGENFTKSSNNSRRILNNSSDLLSFGILSLDVMLLHNIQLMAWESQEAARVKMMKDPEVFAFNALFLDPSTVEARRNELLHSHDNHNKRLNRQDGEDFDLGKNLLENVLELGMSTARAAIHLGRAYKNTKMVLTQLANRDSAIQPSLARNIDGSSHALNHLETSYKKNETTVSQIDHRTDNFTELDCIWLLYCKNLAATSKLNPPYGVMARINGMALRMLTGEVAADKALDIMLYEALSGWTDLKCTEMFPRCSSVSPASVVMDSILQTVKKPQTSKNSQVFLKPQVSKNPS